MKITKEIKKNHGITLMALAITIIILLILAGVTIAALTGNNGIITQATQAKDDTNIAGAKEKIEVEAVKCIDKKGNFNKETFKTNIEKNIKGSSVTERGNSIIVKVDGYKIAVDGITGDIIGIITVEPGVIVSKTEKDNYWDGINTATVPQGFTVSGKEDEQTIENGLVIYDIPKEEVENVNWDEASTKYNQFVWIPVKSEDGYQRNLTYQVSTENICTDTGYLPSNIQPETDDANNNEIAERSAVLKYGGFYVSRYEAGNENSNVVSKQNATIYVNKTQEGFKLVGKTMYGDNSQYVKSAMCSGIQWDMVMKFIDGKLDGTGKVYDVKTYDRNRHTGEVAESGKNLADKVQNIYDLEGNVWEYVAERDSANSSFSFILRGGYYPYGDPNYKASRRNNSDGISRINRTFRLVLYIN